MTHRGELVLINRVLDEADADEPLTAREIAELLAEQGEDLESPHRVATVLGRRAESGDVDGTREQPYRYLFDR